MSGRYGELYLLPTYPQSTGLSVGTGEKLRRTEEKPLRTNLQETRRQMHGLCEHHPRIAGVLAIMCHPSPPCPRPPQSGVADKLCIFNRQPGSETRLQLKTGIGPSERAGVSAKS